MDRTLASGKAELEILLTSCFESSNATQQQLPEISEKDIEAWTKFIYSWGSLATIYSFTQRVSIPASPNPSSSMYLLEFLKWTEENILSRLRVAFDKPSLSSILLQRLSGVLLIMLSDSLDVERSGDLLIGSQQYLIKLLLIADKWISLYLIPLLHTDFNGDDDKLELVLLLFPPISRLLTNCCNKNSLAGNEYTTTTFASLLKSMSNFIATTKKILQNLSKTAIIANTKL